MKKAGDLLGAFFDEGLVHTAKGYSSFFASWKRVVGDRLAAHSRIIELEGSMLVIEADHPGWVQLIQMKRNEILETVRRQFPELPVTAISIKLSKDKPAEKIQRLQRPIGVESPAANSEKTDEETEPNVDPYEKIKDESFKDLLKRLEKSIKSGSR